MKGTKFLSSKAILGIVTAVAVVVTVAGSFAAWDSLTDTATGTVTPRASVTVEKEANLNTFEKGTETEANADLWSNDYWSTTVSFTVAGLQTGETGTLTLTPEIKLNDNTTTDLAVKLYSDSTMQTEVTAPIAVSSTDTAKKTYYVKISPTSTASATHTGTENFTVTVKADLAKTK